MEKGKKKRKLKKLGEYPFEQRQYEQTKHYNQRVKRWHARAEKIRLSEEGQ